MIPLRFACLFMWIATLIRGIGAVGDGDWHLLVAQIAQALIALVLWFSVQSDPETFRAPTFGTRWMRLSLYSLTLLASLAAFLPWKFPFGDVVSLRDSIVMLVAVAVVAPFFNAEWKRQVTP